MTGACVSGWERALISMTVSYSLISSNYRFSSARLSKRANDELSQFAYIVGHDLQEPLRKIQTFVSYIQRADAEKLSAAGKNYFDRIHSSAWRMQQLIIDMLTFSQVNNDQRHFETADLNKI